MDIVLIGASNPETRRQIDNARRADPHFNVVGFLDNDPSKHGTLFCGLRVLGGFEEVAGMLENSALRFVNLITGSTLARFETSRDIARLGGQFANLIDPNIDLRGVEVGVGNYIQDGVIIQTAASIGNNSSVHTSAIIAHEAVIGHSVFIAHEVSISGVVTIGDGTFVGTNATVLPRVAIGKWCIIGAGAVVTKDVPDCSVVVGNPGRVIRSLDVPYVHGDIFSGD